MSTRIIHFALMAGMVGSLVLVAVLRSRQAPTPAKPAPRQENLPAEVRHSVVQADLPSRPEPVDAKKQAVALHDATLIGLIENARMAEQRGDKVTRDAMLSGLKKSSDRSRELISSEISKAKDPGTLAALQSLMEKLE